MAEMHPLMVLSKKELRQNAALFIIPAGVLFVLLLAKAFRASGIPQRYLELMATALPVSLAAAFGLQAFDAEENSQTKDFLLTKPVFPGQIVAAKYLTGLIALLLLSVISEAFLLPESIRPPSLSDYSTFWFYSYCFLVLLVHAACFTVAVYMKGPRKVLYGILFAALAAGWFFTGFFGFLTSLYHFLGDPGVRWSWAAVTLGTALLLYLMAFLLKAAAWALRGLPPAWIRRSLFAFVVGLIFLPLCLSAAAYARQPAIRPFSSLFRTFLGGEEWFVGTTAAKCPGKDLYALADDHGRLAIAKKGGRPKLVYAGKGESSGKGETNGGRSLSSLAWSPDGRWIAFAEDGIVKIFDTIEQKVVPVLEGELAVWSTDPVNMMVLKKEGEVGTYRLSLADFTRRVGVNLGVFDLAGLAVGWDAERNRLLVLGPEGLLVFSIESRQRSFLPFKPSLPAGSAVTAGRVLAPSRPGRPYLLVIFGIPRERSGFDAYLYEYDPVRDVIREIPPLSGLEYQELVFDPESREVLGHQGMGVYRLISWKEDPR